MNQAIKTVFPIKLKKMLTHTWDTLYIKLYIGKR